MRIGIALTNPPNQYPESEHRPGEKENTQHRRNRHIGTRPVPLNTLWKDQRPCEDSRQKQDAHRVPSRHASDRDHQQSQYERDCQRPNVPAKQHVRYLRRPQPYRGKSFNTETTEDSRDHREEAAQECSRCVLCESSVISVLRFLSETASPHQTSTFETTPSQTSRHASSGCCGWISSRRRSRASISVRISFIVPIPILK